MKDKYDDFEGEIFDYSWIFSWLKRNKDYLKKRYERPKDQEYITPPPSNDNNKG